jgi:hypothetical protein
MKRVLAVIATLTYSHAGAAAPSSGGYSESAAKQERCRSDGQVSKSFFGAEPKDILAVFEDIKKKIRDRELSETKGDDLRFLVYSGMTAPSPDAAYMRGWSACMDGKYSFK